MDHEASGPNTRGYHEIPKRMIILTLARSSSYVWEEAGGRDQKGSCADDLIWVWQCGNFGSSTGWVPDWTLPWISLTHDGISATSLPICSLKWMVMMRRSFCVATTLESCRMPGEGGASERPDAPPSRYHQRTKAWFACASSHAAISLYQATAPNDHTDASETGAARPTSYDPI